MLPSLCANTVCVCVCVPVSVRVSVCLCVPRVIVGRWRELDILYYGW